MSISELMQATRRLATSLEWLTEAKFFDKVDSTQNRIQQWLSKSGEGAVLVIAETQTKGVGRQNRIWVSPPGGIWFTLALPLQDMEIAKAAPFSMVAALQVAQSLKEVNDLSCELKWPNDILFEGKKLAGILLSTTKKFRKSWMLVGVGINVNNELPTPLNKEATTIQSVKGQSQGRSRLIESILDKLWTAWQDFDHTGFGPYHKGVEAILGGLGKPIKLALGKRIVQGKMTGVDPQGSLLIDSPSGIKAVQAGEIIEPSAK